MGQILIRNLDDAVLTALRERAALDGVSLEEQTRRALTASVSLSRPQAITALNAVREQIGRIAGQSSARDLRAERDRDDA